LFIGSSSKKEGCRKGLFVLIGYRRKSDRKKNEKVDVGKPENYGLNLMETISIYGRETVVKRK